MFAILLLFSDIEGPKIKKVKKEKVDNSEKLDPSFKITPVAAPLSAPSPKITTTTTLNSASSTASAAVSTTTAASTTSTQSEGSGSTRRLRDFETSEYIKC